MEDRTSYYYLITVTYINFYGGERGIRTLRRLTLHQLLRVKARRPAPFNTPLAPAFVTSDLPRSGPGRERLNQRPRKTLGFASPADKLAEVLR